MVFNDESAVGAGLPKIGPIYTKFTETREDGQVPSPLRMFADVAITSQFKVSLHLATDLSVVGRLQQSSSALNIWLKNTKLLEGNNKLVRYDFLCSQASLPGSTLLSTNETGSYQGVREEFPTRRAYSTFDMTFYVDRDYSIIRLFEEWMNFINPVHTRKDGRMLATDKGYGNAKNSNDFYRLRYPAEYRKIISVTKFERDFIAVKNDRIVDNSRDFNTITYRMIDAYPYNISPVPLTYEGSSVAQFVVSFKYSRYVIETNNRFQNFK